MTTTRARLIEIDWPDFGEGAYPERAPLDEFLGRVEAARAAMTAAGFSHLVVFGDRERFASIAWLTGVEPRFEEMLLILGETGDPLLIVGNECEGYLPWSPTFAAGSLRAERWQPFSLLSQPRHESRALSEILADEGIDRDAKVGCVGAKYFAETELPAGRNAIDLPGYLVDLLRELAGTAAVVNATALFLHPGHGLRTTVSASEIAWMEYTNVQASEGIRAMLFGLREGITDHELMRLGRLNGEPLGCHLTLATGDRPGLCGPTGRTIRRGEVMSTNVCYWGANICRAGWIAESANDLPAPARDYVEAFAGPYVEAMAAWFDRLRIGTRGGELSALIHERLPFERFGIFLNAGHLIHLDEWTSSPIFPDSSLPIRSGMAMQVDVIPSSPVYGSTRMEDGVVVADAALRGELQRRFPDAYARCQARRTFMADVLGIGLPDEVLPLSNIASIVPPWFLRPREVLSLA